MCIQVQTGTRQTIRPAMASLSNAAAYVASFGIQTLLVFAGNSRFFGFLKEGSGWRTNVEMSVLYTSLVTPANWAFAIWGIIYSLELVTDCHLNLGPAYRRSPDPMFSLLAL